MKRDSGIIFAKGKVLSTDRRSMSSSKTPLTVAGNAPPSSVILPCRKIRSDLHRAGWSTAQAGHGTPRDPSALSTLGVLIEHYAGAFPVWLAPVQAMIVTVADAQLDFALAVCEQLRSRGVRVDVDMRSLGTGL